MRAYTHAIISTGRVWTEDYVDTETGDMVSVERYDAIKFTIIKLTTKLDDVSLTAAVPSEDVLNLTSYPYKIDNYILTPCRIELLITFDIHWKLRKAGSNAIGKYLNKALRQTKNSPYIKHMIELRNNTPITK